MNIYPPTTRNRTGNLAVLFAFRILGSATTALAHQKVSRNFPAGKSVRLELKNLSGTITVETWAKDEIRVTATMEAPAPHVNPRQTDAGLVIDIVGDNRGRGDVGDMNFKIQVPARTSVDLETRRGQINVSNIEGDLVRAHISTSGDVTLSGINAARVFASNTTGNIFFDGEFTSGGTYEFKSAKGDITLQLPGNCGFHLAATAPPQKISLRTFCHDGLTLLSQPPTPPAHVGHHRPSPPHPPQH